MAIEPFLGTRAQKGFLFTVLIQAIGVLAMVGITFAYVDEYVDLDQGPYRTIPCYLALFAFAELYEIIVTLDALKRRNIIQLVGTLMFHAGMIVFGAIQIHQTEIALVAHTDVSCLVDYIHCSGPDSLYAKVKTFLIIAPIILSVSLLVLAFFTWQLYHEFGWVVFYIVGANPRMKTMFRYYQILVVLLKFDFFFFSALSMQLLIVVLSRGAEFYLTIIAIPVVMALLAACIVAVQREIKWLMTVSLVVMLGAQAYFLYKFSRLFAGPTRAAYVSTRGSLAVFSIFSFIMLFTTFGVGLKVFADFGKELRDAKLGESKVGEVPKPVYNGDSPNNTMRQSAYMGGAPIGPRISIE